MRDPTDADFARFCAEGDPADLGRVFDATALELLGVAEHLTRDFATAEDLVQSTFLAAIRAAPRFRAGERVRPWLVGILRNLARRRKAPRREGLEAASAAARVAASAARAAQDGEMAGEVRAAVAALPRPYREVVELRLFAEASSGAIAANLRRAPGTVRAQLSRGLEMLRSGLPAGLTAGLAGIPDLAGMRATVLRAAQPGVAGGATALAAAAGAGLLMKTKLMVLSAAALAVAAAVWWLADASPTSVAPIARDDPPPPFVSTAPAVRDPAEASRSPAGVVPAPVVMPPAVAPAPVAAEAGDRAALLVEVVDADGVAVPGATIALSGGPTSTSPFSTWNSLAGRTRASVPSPSVAPPPAERQVTDAGGRAAVALHPLHTQLAASKDGVGESGTLTIPIGIPDSGRPWRVELRRRAVIRGRVLDERGLPIAAASVGGQTIPPQPVERVTTSGDGAFELAIPGAGTYHLSATAGERTTETVAVRVGEDLAPETVELCIPGGFAVGGQVVDPRGAPVAGAEVDVWRVEEGSKLEYPFNKTARTEGDGSFSVPLGRPGTYRLAVRATGLAGPTPCEHVLTRARPRTDSLLRLQEFAEIRGRVSTDDGRPLAGLNVCADVGVGGDSARWPLRRIYGPDPYAQARTDASGAFAISGLHPDAVYDVTVFLDPRRYRLTLRERGVRAGTTDLLFVFRGEQRAGAIVRGRVFEADTLRPLTAFGVRLWKFYGDGKPYPEEVILDPSATARGEFTVQDLAIGAEYSLVVQAEGFAPLVSPRFSMRDAEQAMDFAVRTFADVDLLVVGGAAGDRRIAISRRTEHPEPLDVPPVIADGAGRASVRLPPGSYVATCGDKTAEVEAVAGLRSEVRLR